MKDIMLTLIIITVLLSFKYEEKRERKSKFSNPNIFATGFYLIGITKKKKNTYIVEIVYTSRYIVTITRQSE